MVLLNKIKVYLYAMGAAAFGLLLVAVKYLSKKNSRLEREVDTAQANIKRRQIIAEADIEIEKTEREIRERIKNRPDSPTVDPNSLWDNDDSTR